MRFIVPKKPSAAGASPQTPAGSLWHPHSLVTYLRTWHSGVARNLFRRGQNRETGDRSVPQRGPGAPPEAEDIYANSNCNNAGSIPNFFSMGISGGCQPCSPFPTPRTWLIVPWVLKMDEPPQYFPYVGAYGYWDHVTNRHMQRLMTSVVAPRGGALRCFCPRAQETLVTPLGKGGCEVGRLRNERLLINQCSMLFAKCVLLSAADSD